MRTRHLTREVLDRLAARGHDEEEHLLFLHHLAVCPECYQVAGSILDLYEAGEIDAKFSSVDLGLASSRVEAPALLARLEPYPHKKALGLVRDTRRFRSWGLAELLAKESVGRASHDPTRAIELAELSVAVSLAVRPGAPAEPAWLDQLRAYAWAHLGNARRVVGELRSAEEAFGVADLHWNQGAKSAGDALGYGAWILCLKASLRAAQFRLDEALALIEAALASDMAEPLIGTLLVNKAGVLEELGDLAGAIRHLEEAALKIEAAKRPRLFLCARHNLLDALSKAERFEEGERLLPEVRRLAAGGGEMDLLRLSWIEARLLVGRGQIGKAAHRFREVRDAFLDRAMGYDCALATLELAVLLLGNRRAEEAGALAEEILPIFLAADVHREALAGLAIFRQAAELNELTLDLARRIHNFLLRARRNPTLRFEH